MKRNFVALTREEKARVPRQAINRALDFMGHSSPPELMGATAHAQAPHQASVAPEQDPSESVQTPAGQVEPKN